MEKTYKVLKLIIWILLFAVLIAGASLLYDRLSAQMDPIGLATEATIGATEKAPTPVPDFTFYDADGNAYKLSDFRGKPVILNFWASWCGPCQMEMPAIEEVYQEYGDEIHFLIVNLTDGFQETVEKASAYIAEQGYTFPVYYDTDMEGAYGYSVTGIPVTYFIDAEGNFAANYQSSMTTSILQQGVDILIG